MSQLQMTFRDMLRSDSVSSHVERRAEKLETFFRPIVRCRVVLEAPHRHHLHGKQYRVCIRITVPGEELVIDHPAGDDARFEDLHVAIDCAFDSAAVVLQNLGHRRHQAVRHAAG